MDDDEENRLEFLRKKIPQKNILPKYSHIKAFELKGKIVENLKLLRSLIQSEKVKQKLFTKPFEENLSSISTVEKIKEIIISELISYNEKDLAQFSIPKKYFDECYELLISAWRQKIHKRYSTTLTFTNTPFTFESFRAFVVAITLNVSLKALKLERCNLSEKELKVLSIFVKLHPTLSYLYLDHNPIEDIGAEPLIEAINHSESLLHLSLIDAQLEDKSIFSIIKLLKKRPLKSLFLEGNKFSEEALMSLKKEAIALDITLSADNRADFDETL